MINVTVDTGFTIAQTNLIASAVLRCNKVVATEVFTAAVLTMKNVQESKDSPQVILENVRKEIHVHVAPWSPWWPWSAALAQEKAGAILLNVRRLPALSVDDLASILLHEASHAIGYHHSSNYESKAYFTVPYQLNRAYSQAAAHVAS